MNYTKGEWKTDAEITDDVTVYCESKPGRFLTIATIKAKPDDRERRANAHLIAAAPKMYEALKEVAYCFTLIKQTTGGEYPILDKMNKILAEAEVIK